MNWILERTVVYNKLKNPGLICCVSASQILS